MAEVQGNEAQDSGLTKGAKVKADGSVLQELALNLQKPANVSCRVEKFGNVVETLSPQKKRWVAEMGFEGLLFFVGCHLPRSLCYWLATRVDCEKEVLVTSDGFTFPLSKAQVHWILGLPHGPNPVPNRVKGKRMKRETRLIWQRYGSVTKGGTREIKGKAIVDAVDNPAAAKTEFKRAFLMFALNELLCPTTSTRLSLQLLPAVTVYEEAQDYDWCSLVLDHLLHYLKKFAKKFDTHGFARSCGGCTFYLAVLYLDRLRRPPLRWGMLPRIKVWVTKEVNKAKSQDRIRFGDYGKLGCLDAAYGERHPNEARDSFPAEHECSTGRRSNLRPTNQYYTSTPARSHLKKRNKATNGNPYQRKLLKRMREATDTHDNGNLHQDPSPPRTPVNLSGSATHGTGRLHSPRLQREEPANEDFCPRDNDSCTVQGGNREDGFQLADQSKRTSNHRCDSAEETASDTQVSKQVTNVINDVCDQYADVTLSVPSPWGAWRSETPNDLDRSDKNSDVADSTPGTPTKSQPEQDHYVAIDIGQDIGEEPRPPPGFEETPFQVPIQHTPGTRAVVSHSSDRGNQPDNLHRDPLSDKYGRSHKQRVTKPSTKFSPGYLKIWRPSENGSLKMKLSRVVLSAIRDPRNNPVLLECDGVGVRLASVVAVVKPESNLSIEYVDALSVLYTKVWAAKWSGRSRKVMLSPWFACDALNTIEGRSPASDSAKATIHRLSQCQEKMINVVFVPVWEDSRWWAVAFSFNRQEIRVLDPTGRPLKDLLAATMKLGASLRSLFNMVFPSWNIGDFAHWTVVKPEYHDHCDSLASGVATLMSIKRCEDRFNTTLFGELDGTQRAWLLWEDLMHDLNGAKGVVKLWLQTKRRK